MMPNGWSETLLKDLVVDDRKITYGIVQPGEFDPNGVPLIRGKDYSFGWVPIEDFFRVSPEVDKPYKRSKVRPGDILLTIVGAGTGNTAIVPSYLENANITQTTARIAIDDSKAHPIFVHQYLNSEINTKLNLRKHVKGAAQPGLNLADVEIFRVLLPPLDEQEKIAKILSTWDQAIEKLGRIISQKESQKTSFEKLFFFKQAPTKTILLGDCFERVNRKNSNLESDNVLTISAQHGLINQRDFFKKSVASKNTASYYLLKKGDFAYNKSYSAGYPLGAIKPLEAYEHGIVSPLYICFRLKQNSQRRTSFYKHFFESGAFDLQIASIAQEGARNHGLLNVSVIDFFNLKVPDFSDAQVEQLSLLFDFVDKELQLYRDKLTCFKLQKQGLMQQLLTGKKRVKV